MKQFWYYFILLFIGLSTNCSQNSKPDSPVLEAPTFERIFPKIVKYDYDTTIWVDVQQLDSTIIIDMRYATQNNFMGKQLYECNRCFVRPQVGRQLKRISDELNGKGWRLKMFDCYRPEPVQWELWEKNPDPRYVTNPNKGSMHSRGLAVDLTLTDKSGREIEMGTAFDYFGIEAYHSYEQLPDSVLQMRLLLKSTMEKYNFRSIRTEWWHYSFRNLSHPIANTWWNCE